jgi:hypothetical protein
MFFPLPAAMPANLSQEMPALAIKAGAVVAHAH